MDYTKDMHELCETLSAEVAEMNDKFRAAGGKMSTGDLDTLDKLTHALKSVKAIISMGDDGYSGRYPYDGSYARRDMRGRYSRTGLADRVRGLMDEAPDDRTRQEMERLVRRLETA